MHGASGCVGSLLALALAATSCVDRPSSDGAGRHDAANAGAALSVPRGDAWFTDEARGSALDFVHFNGMTGEFRFPEVIPPGIALLDYDGDGDLDVFVTEGAMLGGHAPSDALVLPPGPLTSRLYRNDLVVRADGTRVLRFTDVTATSGIAVPGYAMGAAAGDFDNDGCVDLYVTHIERSQLFRNRCDGRFGDVSASSRAGDEGWTVSAAFLDYDCRQGFDG